MKTLSRTSTLALMSALAFSTAACSGGGDADSAAAGSAGNEEEASADLPTIADGADYCYRQVADHFGADVMVKGLSSRYSTGPDLALVGDTPKGQLTGCSVDYQNPENPLGLLSSQLDMATGEFSEPQRVEISVMGDASEFNLADYLIPLSDVNMGSVQAFMDSNVADLDGAYSNYAWSAVDLNAPGISDDQHTINVRLEGRLASNDIKESGSAVLRVDGTSVKYNNLVP